MKKPSYKNIRQGKTIYMVAVPWYKACSQKREVFEYFIYSQKQPLPEPGCILEKLPVTHLREYIKRFGNKALFFSKKKAEKYAKSITRH